MRLAARCPCLAARARPAALGGAGAAGCGPRVGQRRERLCPAAQAVLRNSMTPEQRLAMVQAHRRARRQLAAIHSARPRCRTVASELLSDDPSFRGRAARPPPCRCPGRRARVRVAVQHAPGRGPCLGAGGRPHGGPGGARRAARVAAAGRPVAAALSWGGVWSGADARRGTPAARRPQAYAQVLAALEQPQVLLLEELETYGVLRYTLCCILSPFQVRPCPTFRLSSPAFWRTACRPAPPTGACAAASGRVHWEAATRARLRAGCARAVRDAVRGVVPAHRADVPHRGQSGGAGGRDVHDALTAPAGGRRGARAGRCDLLREVIEPVCAGLSWFPCARAPPP